MRKILALTETLEAIRDETRGDTIDTKELLDVLNSRGYGPLLIGPALLVILPTGAIPGMPLICGMLLISVSLQILFKKKHPWMPKRIKNLSFDRKRALKTIDQVKPYTEKLDALFYPRLPFLVRRELKPLIAAISIILSFFIMLFGFIPFLAIIPALGVLLLGISMTAKDGLLFLLSLTACIACLCILPYAHGVIF